MADFVKAAELKDIPEDGGLVVQVDGRELGLFLVDGEVHAIDNICPHRDGPLAEGILEGKIISCPWHHWTFDVTTGRCTFHDSLAVAKFPVRVEGGEILVRVPPELAGDRETGPSDGVALPPNR